MRSSAKTRTPPTASSPNKVPASLYKFARAPWPRLFLCLTAGIFALSLSAIASFARQTAAAPAQTTPAAAPPQATATLVQDQKLVLTDGSYQLVRDYQRDGDRVRYYSVERSAWEEIPASLVDWPATEKAAAEQQAAEKALDQKLAAADHAAAVAGIDSDRSYEARPGVILPDDVGLYIVADSQSKALEQNQAVSHADTLRAAERIASGVPLIPTKAYIDIKPKHAQIRIRSGAMEFYFRTADGREPKLQLLKADVESDRRKLGIVSTSFAGQNKYKSNQIEMMESEAARGLYRFTLDRKLMPGEYALVELTHENEVDLYVWDFGVDNVSGNAGAFLRNIPLK